MSESNLLQLYTNQFCPFSQRPIIALYEASIEFNLVEIPSDKLPEWIYDLSPQGVLPILKEADGEIITGWDTICSYLEKHPTIQNLSHEKIEYENALNHCRTKLEPVVEHILDNSIVQRSISTLKEILFNELEFLENNIEGPFFLGSNITWIDINYWTILERFSLLKHSYDIEVPKDYKKIHQWLERLNRVQSFEKSKFLQEEYLKWYNNQIMTFSICPVKYINTINTSLRNGINELVSKIEDLDIYNNRDHAFDICTSFSLFDCVLREHTRSKLQTYFKAIEEKDPHLALVISKKFEDEQQMLDEIHELLSKSIYISNMKYQLSNQNDDDDNRNNNQPLKSVIHWRLEKFENENPPNILRNNLIQNVKEFKRQFIDNLENEETTLTEKRVAQLFSPNTELTYLAKRLICLSNESFFSVCYSWIINHLPNNQGEFFVKCLQSAMPYQFTDIYHHLEGTVSNLRWSYIASKLENSYETPLQNSQTYQQLFTQKKPLKKNVLKKVTISSHLEKNNVGKSNSEDLALRFDDGPKKPRRRPNSKAYSPGFVEPDPPRLSQTMSRPRGSTEFSAHLQFFEKRNTLNLEPPKLKTPAKRVNNIKESRSENFSAFEISNREKERRNSNTLSKNNNNNNDELISPKINNMEELNQSNNEENPVPSDNQENQDNNNNKEDINSVSKTVKLDMWDRYLNDNSRFPLAIFTLASKVIKSRVIHLEEMAKRRHRFNNLGPLEEALEVLTYIVIQDLQADIALLPTLCRKKEDLAPIFKVYSMDHSVTLKLIKKISSQFSFIKNSDSLEQLESSIDQLFEDIIQVTTLEKYFINKDESLIFPLISEYIPVHLQPKLTREILDISPPQYFTKMLPWIVKQLSLDDQIVFIETLRASLPVHQFDYLLAKIRKVLTIQQNINLFK